jgi:ABC-type branched-subunit amino acid transport system substrate-binding protein
MRKRKLLLILAVAFLARVFFIISPFAQQNLKIGSFNPLTGPASFTGINADRGVDLCGDQWNKKGGINIKGR